VPRKDNQVPSAPVTLRANASRIRSPPTLSTFFCGETANTRKLVLRTPRSASLDEHRRSAEPVVAASRKSASVSGRYSVRTEDLLARANSAIVTESDEIALTATETIAVSTAGGVSCDVWVRVPTTWLDGAEIALFGVVGSARVEIGRVEIGGAGATKVDRFLSANVLRVRGRPCDGFEATVRWRPGKLDAPRDSGRVILQVFDADAQASVEHAAPFQQGTIEAAPFFAALTTRSLQTADVTVGYLLGSRIKVVSIRRLTLRAAAQASYIFRVERCSESATGSAAAIFRGDRDAPTATPKSGGTTTQVNGEGALFQVSCAQGDRFEHVWEPAPGQGPIVLAKSATSGIRVYADASPGSTAATVATATFEWTEA
jgi:hypothetical protein